MQSIKSKTEQEQRDKVERNISKLKEIKIVITIKISDIVNRYITVSTSKYAGNQVTVNSYETAVNSNSKNNNKSNIIEQGNSNDKNIMMTERESGVNARDICLLDVGGSDKDKRDEYSSS